MFVRTPGVRHYQTVCNSVLPFSRYSYALAYRNLLNELGDQAGQHEVIAENLSTQVVHELSALVKQLKDDRRKVRKEPCEPCIAYTIIAEADLLRRKSLASHMPFVWRTI